MRPNQALRQETSLYSNQVMSKVLEKENDRYKAAQQALLDWYDVHHRDLPWRMPPDSYKKGLRPDPYHVWLSEIMLQQTTVPTVKSYFAAFTARWPKVTDLAAAPRDDVMAAWAGLGYYARARNLHLTAQIIANDHDGIFPETEDELLKLPGIGGYTAAAIAAIAFGQPAVVVDGNIERVVARWADLQTPLPKVKPEIYAVMTGLTPHKRAGDFAQAMMDLGSSICTASRKTGARKKDSAKTEANLTLPSCLICPLQPTCATTGEAAAVLPRKMPKKKRPDRRGTALIITDGKGQIIVARRPDQIGTGGGMLGGLDVFPGSAWADGSRQISDYPITPDSPAGQFKSAHQNGQKLNQQVEHIFSHFRVILDIEKIEITKAKDDLPTNWRWVAIKDLPEMALPTVMVKTARLAGVWVDPSKDA